MELIGKVQTSAMSSWVESVGLLHLRALGFQEVKLRV